MYYDLSQLDEAQRTAMQNAIDHWHASNQANGSGVTFAQASSGNPATLVFAPTPTATCQTNLAAAVCTQVSPPSSPNIASAEIVLNLTATLSDGSPAFDPSQPNYTEFLKKVGLHEIGHTMGFAEQPSDCSNPTPSSVMNTFCGTNDVGNNMPTTVTACDELAVADNPAYEAPPLDPPGGGGETSCVPIDGCEQYDPEDICICLTDPSPIVLAIGQTQQYLLDGPGSGVYFDITANGVPDRIGWTRAGDPVALLALDRNDNGLIDNGSELFGNYTPLHAGGVAKHGFEALAEFDLPVHGGNGDGVISGEDEIWSRLLLWLDTNHDGISQGHELLPISQSGISSISVAAGPQKRRDRHGNVFRLRSTFTFQGQQRLCYDVFFARQ